MARRSRTSKGSRTSTPSARFRPQFHVPRTMWAWAIRKERHGRPKQAMQLEQVPTPEVGEDEALVLVMAAGRQLQRHLGRAW